jgi:transposase
MALSITRTDLTVEQLRAAAAREPDARIARRILAIAMVLAGHSRQAAAEAQAMERQTLRDWVIRYNEHGLAGLADRPRPGRPSLLNADQEAQLESWVEQGPDLVKDGPVRWRRLDLRERIMQRFGITMHERSVGKILRRLNFRRISVRPQHPQSDEAAQEAFKKTSPRWFVPRSRRKMPWTAPSRSGSRTKPESASTVP